MMHESRIKFKKKQHNRMSEKADHLSSDLLIPLNERQASTKRHGSITPGVTKPDTFSFTAFFLAWWCCWSQIY